MKKITMEKRRKDRLGVALLLVVGILALITMIGISFAINMLLAKKEASNFLSSLKARYIAEAGINRAMADIRNQIVTNSYTALTSYVSSYVANFGTNISFGEGNYTLTITSEAGKVNINYFDENDGSQITALRTFLTDQQIANVIDYRDSDTTNTMIGVSTGNIEGTARCKNKPYDSIEEIRLATGINRTTFENNKNTLTINKPIMRGGLLGRYYHLLNGSSPNIQIDKTSWRGTVVELGPVYQTPNDQDLPMADGDSGDSWGETHDCEMAGGYLVDNPGDFGMTVFGVVWDGYLEIFASDVGTPKRFWIASDDGARFYINDTLVCQIWTDTASSYPGDRTAFGEYTFNAAGWHRIRLEYYDQVLHNSVQLKWTNSGGDFWTAPYIPSDRLGYEAPTESGPYNNAGNYKIACAAKVNIGTEMRAQQRLSATLKVFGTWTQTTRTEFYAAFFGDNAQLDQAGTGDDYRDGEVKNVTWADSCPTDTDFWDAGASKMHWEMAGIYATVPDSLKLGFWDNMDEDPGYSAIMWKGYRWNQSWWGSDVLYISFQDFQDNDGDGDNEIFLDTNNVEAKHFEVNRYYFRPDTQSVFVRAYVKEPAPSSRIAWRGGGTVYPLAFPPPKWPLYGGSPRWSYYYDLDGDGVFDGDFAAGTGEPEVYPVYDASGNRTYIYNPEDKSSGELNSVPPPGSYAYWQPEAPFCGCWVFAKGNADDGWPMGSAGQTMYAYGFKTLLTDGHGNIDVPAEPKPLYPFGDRCEIRLGKNAGTYPQFNYLSDKALSLIGWDDGVNAQYASWANGTLGNIQANGADWTWDYPNGPIFKFVACNQYVGWDWADFERGQHVIGPWDWTKAGAVTKQNTHWDNVRAIPENGFLVSYPAYCGATNVKWGTVSWTADTPANTSVTMYVRTTTTGLATTDTFLFLPPYANGGSIAGAGKRVQYKAVLATTNIIRTSYTNSSATPVLRDVTVTYMPIVEIFYSKSEM